MKESVHRKKNIFQKKRSLIIDMWESLIESYGVKDLYPFHLVWRRDSNSRALPGKHKALSSKLSITMLKWNITGKCSLGEGIRSTEGIHFEKELIREGVIRE